jgi:hypothetical protein
MVELLFAMSLVSKPDHSNDLHWQIMAQFPAWHEEGTMNQLFWSSEEAWAAIEPFMPRTQSGARRMDGRPVISDIFHVLKSGCPMVRLP